MITDSDIEGGPFSRLRREFFIGGSGTAITFDYVMSGRQQRASLANSANRFELASLWVKFDLWRRLRGLIICCVCSDERVDELRSEETWASWLRIVTGGLLAALSFRITINLNLLLCRTQATVSPRAA